MIVAAPVVKHEKPAKQARAKAKKNEKPAEDPAYDLERSTSFSAKEILFWDEGRRLVYQGSRGRARARLPILVPAYQPARTRNKRTSEARVEGEPKRWKVARIFAARNLFCLRLGTLSSKIREKRNRNVIRSVLVIY